MSYKKLLISIILLGLLSLNYSPILAKNCQCSDKNLKTLEYKYNYVNLQWWKSYNDKYLEDYIERAVKENQDLAVATLKVEEARQNVKLQFSKELPYAGIGAAPAVYKDINSTSSQGLLAFPALVSYEADVFRKNHDKTNATKKLFEVSKFDEKSTYISVASEVGATYFNIVKLDKIIDIQNEIIKNRQRIYELMHTRNLEGITSTADLVKANKAFVMANIDLVDLKKTRKNLLTNLAVLIGESPNNVEDLKRISYDELVAKIDVPNEIPTEIITQRPDYLSAEKQVEKAGLDVKIAKKEFLPTFNIGGLLMFTATSNYNALSWGNAIAALGAGGWLPLFTGGEKTANLKLKKNKYEQILKTYYKTNLTAIKEVNDSLSTLKLDDEKYKKNIVNLNMQKEDFQHVKNRYNNGTISHLDVIQQQENLLVTGKLLVDSRINCYIDEISLYKAVGGNL